jgi:energy-coupling factor transporter ATP-binding protein EcfA2
MYISELNIHGFKSFAKKEKITFGEGITVIVGPNGCGKTNIVDAIRWVLGEQKYSVLRSGKMGDIIFNGTDALKIISPVFPERSTEYFCSPSTHRIASTILVLPQPLGPTITVIPSPNVIFSFLAKDLKPWIFSSDIYIFRGKRGE